MKIPIYVSSGQQHQLEILGVDTEGGGMTAEINVCRQDIRAYWVDPEPDAETGERRIVWYTATDNFVSPYSAGLEMIFATIIQNNENPLNT